MWLKEFLLCLQHKELSLIFNSYSPLPTPPCFPITGSNVIIMFIAVSTILWGNYSHINSQKVPAAAAKSTQSCPTLCDPIDGSPRGSPIPGILQARTLEWVAISFSNAWKWKLKVKTLSREDTQSYPTSSDPMDCSPPGFSIHGIFQARVLE